MRKQLLILASPSGGGKSTVAQHLMKIFTDLRFSVSATTRNKRPGETDGKEYYFLNREAFEAAILRNEFVEYEEIFGNLYGTLKTEIEDAIKNNENLIFDIDVKGALSLKKLYPENSILIFIAPPSMEELEQRLRRRSTESDEQIAIRLSRAAMEMSLQSEFDYVIENNVLEETLSTAESIVRENCY